MQLLFSMSSMSDTTLLLQYLSINPESASLLIQLNGSDTWDFPGLLDVAAMAANGQTHQIWSHHELLLEGRHQLPGALNKT